MLHETMRDLKQQAKKLMKPYEEYSIDELANAYCEAVDTSNETLKSVYISALILRFWYTIDRMYKSNSVAPSLEREDFFWWLYEAIELACQYRAWQNPDKKLNAKQCIHKCIATTRLREYYQLRLDKKKTANNCISLATPVDGEDVGVTRTLQDTLEAEETIEDMIARSSVTMLVQSCINRNKVIEAIIIDTIAFNDTRKKHKRQIKTTNAAGNPYKYTEYSSEFWPYKLVQTINNLPRDYKRDFLQRYKISEEKLATVLGVIEKTPNVKLYQYLRNSISELRASYQVG